MSLTAGSLTLIVLYRVRQNIGIPDAGRTIDAIESKSKEIQIMRLMLHYLFTIGILTVYGGQV